MVGVAKLLLGHGAGVAMVLLGAGLAVFLFWVIDPKLRAVSEDYERRQAAYLDQLESGLRWEEMDGEMQRTHLSGGGA
jgi:hypothetical protein